jgi:predicted nucleic acid-binding protein
MTKDIFDTNIYIKYDVIPNEKLLFSAVVLQEMTVGALDSNELREWEALRKGLEARNLLLIPNGEDWFLAGKVLNALLRGLKSKNKGKIPKLSPDEKQRIIRDVLIARTVKRENGRLVTDNIKDFELIKRFCNIKLISGKDYFAE